MASQPVLEISNYVTAEPGTKTITTPSPIHLQGKVKITETTVKDSRFFINTDLGHHLPVKQLVFFVE